MSRVRYTGVADAAAEFEKLRPAMHQLRNMQANCRPFHEDYLILGAALNALQTACFHFTRDPYFFGGRPHG